MTELLWHLYVYKNRLRASWSELDRFNSLDPQAARHEIGSRLLAQLRYFASREDALPGWKEAARARDVEDLWRIWPSLPIMRKADLVNRFDPLEMQRRFHIRGLVKATGGSTGEPTRFLHDPRMVDIGVATATYARLRLGWRPKLKTICVWGSQRDVRQRSTLRQKLLLKMQNESVVDGYSLGLHTVDAVTRIMKTHPTVAIYGFSSMLEFVARELKAGGIDRFRGRVSVAWNGGEMLLESQSDIFEEVFGVRILNWYGGRELSVMAYQQKPKGPLYVLRPYLFAEIVDENDKPVAPGEVGRLVWTSTVCRGTPFLRYDIGDLATASSENQNESGIFGLQQLHGRTAGLLTLPSGKTINCLYWNHLLKDFPEVTQFQVAVQSGQTVELRLKGQPFSPSREQELRHILNQLLVDVPVAINWLDQIPLTRDGKLVQVVQE
jgi:phenylacetate-CoA ligase